METHAHHLHKTPGKNFWHYLFEFLMLFLAVFCGFLAENLRERQGEKERSKQYVQSFYEDLKADSVSLSTMINQNDSTIEGLKDLSDCFNVIKTNKKDAACITKLLRNSVFFREFRLTDRTLKQLESAGGFRLLDKPDADSILKYQTTYGYYFGFETTVHQIAQDNLRNTYNKAIAFETTSQLFKTSKTQDLSSSFNENFSGDILLTKNDDLLSQYFNELFMYYRVQVDAQGRLINLKQNQVRLMKYFKNKYHLE